MDKLIESRAVAAIDVHIGVRLDKMSDHGSKTLSSPLTYSAISTLPCAVDAGEASMHP